MGTRGLGFWLALCIAAVPAAAQIEESGGCCLWTFSGDLVPVGAGTCGGVTVTFGPSWVSIADVDVGGTGQFSYEPTPDSGAYVPSGGTMDPIDFSTPVSHVSLHYVSGMVPTQFRLFAWDGPGGTGNQVDSDLGTVFGIDSSECPGNPSGVFCKWDVVRVETPTPLIRSVTIGAAPSVFVIDNFTYCENAQCSIAPQVGIFGSPTIAVGLSRYPSSALPTLGNLGFAQNVSMPSSCIGTSVSGQTFRAVSLTTGSFPLADTGCSTGSTGSLFLGLPLLSIDGPVSWSGSNGLSIHPLPIPFNAALCGVTVYTQGLIVEISATFGFRYVLTNRENLGLGL